MAQKLKEKLVARRVKGGANADQSSLLLEEIINHFAAGDNLAFALHYNNFATPLQAGKAAAALAS